MTDQMQNPIEFSWEIFKARIFPDGSCCDECMRLYRDVFFSGAMAALHQISGWQPEQIGGTISVSVANVKTIATELSMDWHSDACAHQTTGATN